MIDPRVKFYQALVNATVHVFVVRNAVFDKFGCAESATPVYASRRIMVGTVSSVTPKTCWLLVID